MARPHCCTAHHSKTDDPYPLVADYNDVIGTFAELRMKCKSLKTNNTNNNRVDHQIRCMQVQCALINKTNFNSRQSLICFFMGKMKISENRGGQAV